MIRDTLEALAQYKGIHPRLDRCIDFILSRDPASLPEGRTDIEGDGLYVTVSRGRLRAAGEAPWEIHARYLDLQLGLDGGETVLCAPKGSLDGWGPWLENDIAFTDDPARGAALPLDTGTFVILFPSDANKPGIGEGRGHKAVFKILWDR